MRGDRPRKPRAVNAELTTLSAVFSLAVRLRQLRENPCRKVKWLEAEEGPSRRLSSEEEEALLEAAELQGEYLAPMIRLALWTGFRQGELIALAKSAVDFDRNRVFVVNPKWRKDKRKSEGNPMGPQVRELLASLSEAARGSSSSLTSTGAGSSVTSSGTHSAGRASGPQSNPCASTTSDTSTARAWATPT